MHQAKPDTSSTFTKPNAHHWKHETPFGPYSSAISTRMIFILSIVILFYYLYFGPCSRDFMGNTFNALRFSRFCYILNSFG